jgi:hypothetical protein
LIDAGSSGLLARHFRFARNGDISTNCAVYTSDATLSHVSHVTDNEALTKEIACECASLVVNMADTLALLAAWAGAAVLDIASEPGAASRGSTDRLGPDAVGSSQETADTRAALRAMLQGRPVVL